MLHIYVNVRVFECWSAQQPWVWETQRCSAHSRQLFQQQPKKPFVEGIHQLMCQQDVYPNSLYCSNLRSPHSDIIWIILIYNALYSYIHTSTFHVWDHSRSDVSCEHGYDSKWLWNYGRFLLRYLRACACKHAWMYWNRNICGMTQKHSAQTNSVAKSHPKCNQTKGGHSEHLCN